MKSYSSSGGGDYVSWMNMEKIKLAKKTIANLKGGMLSKEEEESLCRCRDVLMTKLHPLDAGYDEVKSHLIERINKILGVSKDLPAIALVGRVLR